LEGTTIEQVVIPRWLRGVDILVGTISIALCVLVLIGFVPSNVAILVLVTLALFMVGLARFARAAAVTAKGTARRAINLVAGCIGIAAASLLMFNIELPEEQLLVLLAVAWFIMGLARISIGIIEKDVSLWVRILQVIVGFTTIALTGVVALYSAADFSAFVLFLLIVVMANGLARTSRGYVGV
jgi:hypothetical protein